MRNRLFCLTVLCLLFLLISFGNSCVTSPPESSDSSKPSISNPDTSNPPSQSNNLNASLAFDPAWKTAGKTPFVEKGEHFELPVKIGAAQSIRFPKVLDAKTPIVIHTRGEPVKQYLVSQDTYKAELAGKYLVYKGERNSILYRYDANRRALREYVYLEKSSDLPKSREVIQWRFEGADLELREDGGIVLTRTKDIKAEIRKVSDNNMAERISRFLAKRRGVPLNEGPVTQTLFVIPAPEYIDGNHKIRTQGVRYEVVNQKITLHLQPKATPVFPLWIDPTLTADADANVIMNGQGIGDLFGHSVASAGDFNGDGVDDVIVGAVNDDNNGLGDSGSAFIFFGGRTGTINNPDTSADVVLNGQGANDHFGFSVASAGDFNGDGLDDVIVGAIWDDNNGLTESGSAFIFFGGQTGTINNPDTSADVVLNGQGAGDQFGFSVASAGDFNGDGVADVIVGARFDDNNGLISSGSAFIFFGGQTGTINDPDTSADVVLNGQGEADLFGHSVASAGDFNGDGKDDVIVGAPADDNNGLISSGSAFIFFGGQTGTINNPDTSADVVLNGQGEADLFGHSVASAGDFNGDGLDDVIVGAPFDDNFDVIFFGSVFIIFGGDRSGSAFIFFGGRTGTINNPDTSADLVLNGQGVGDEFGSSVASAGDFNADGLDDVIVGALLDDNNGLTDSGSAFIFFGGQTGTINNPNSSANVVLNGQGTNNWFGSSVASAGDFNGDGVDDVIVGAVFDDNNGLTSSGSAFIFSGTRRFNVVLNGQDGGDDPFFELGDLFGHSVASAGDFNGDGKDDVIVGAPADDNNGLISSGSAFIFFGGRTGTINNPDTSADVVLNGQGAGDSFGGSVASAGDFNGDGLDDVIVGAPFDDNSDVCLNTICQSGSAFIFFGGRTGTINNPDTSADVVLNGQGAADLFGGSVASAGDFNGDGLDDVIVGAAFDDNNGLIDSGSAFIFFGGRTGTINNPDTSADVVLNGQDGKDFFTAFGDRFGRSVASAGDFNGDGKDDVIVGAPADANLGLADPPSAYIFFGGRTGTINNPDTGADVVLNGLLRTRFGGSVASAGDFNGDGKDDVIVGARFDDSAFIFFGGQTGTINDPDTSADVVLDGQVFFDDFGVSVASAGDFNGDGLDDVIVGARFEDNNGLISSGSAFIFFGGQTGTINNPDITANVVRNGQGAGDQFGGSVASAGDFNGDGLDDVIVGARFDDNNGLTDSGSAFIIFGKGPNTPPTPTLSINDVSILEGDPGDTVALDFTVTLSAPSTQSVTVSYNTQNGTAIRISDYVPVSSGSVFFAVGETSQTISIQVIEDLNVEADETFSVILSNPQNAPIGDGTGVGTILNDEDNITVNISDASAVEGDVSTDNVTVDFTVTLSAAPTKPVTVSYRTSLGTAIRNIDYVPVFSGSISFLAGQTSQTISIQVIEDLNVEADETFLVTLSSPQNTLIGDGLGVGTILNDEDNITVNISDASAVEGDPGDTVTVDFTVTLSAAPTKPVTVSYNTQNGTAIGGADYVPVFSSISFLAGQTSQTISIQVIEDLNVEADETFLVTLFSPQNTLIGDRTGVGTILNDDLPDTTAPVITLLGTSPISVLVGSLYDATVDAGATALDNVDGVITASIVIGGLPIDTSVPGTHTVTYDVSDAAGNPATQVTRTVNVVAPNTPASTTNPDGTVNPVFVEPIDTTTEQPSTTVDLTFDQVDTAGTTTVTTTSTGPVAPSGFSLGDPAVYFDINTTATFTTVEVCISYAGISFPFGQSPKLDHFDDIDGWVDITTSVDTVNQIVCGVTDSFSLFALFAPPLIFDGFKAPIDNLPVINSAKAGRTLPVKWSLPKPGGGFIQDLSVVTGLQIQQVTCPDGPLVNEVPEDTLTAGESGLHYDTTDEQFVYNWKTSKSMSGICYNFILTLTDTSQHIAVFELK